MNSVRRLGNDVSYWGTTMNPCAFQRSSLSSFIFFTNPSLTPNGFFSHLSFSHQSSSSSSLLPSSSFQLSSLLFVKVSFHLHLHPKTMHAFSSTSSHTTASRKHNINTKFKFSFKTISTFFPSTCFSFVDFD